MPAALPGIFGGVMLAVSRAIGETMIVVMAAGLAANLTANLLNAVTTVTVQIVTLLVGDQEFDSPKTLAAFALGLVLFEQGQVLRRQLLQKGGFAAQIRHLKYLSERIFLFIKYIVFMIYNNI